MNYLIFAMGGFLFLLAIDIATSRNTVEVDPADLDSNGMPGDFPTREDLEFMELITEPNRDLGEA